jgi:hypothetical protein
MKVMMAETRLCAPEVSWSVCGMPFPVDYFLVEIWLTFRRRSVVVVVNDVKDYLVDE